MVSFVRLLCSFIALAVLSEIVIGQSVDQSEEMAFFDIDDSSDNDNYNVLIRYHK